MLKCEDTCKCTCEFIIYNYNSENDNLSLYTHLVPSGTNMPPYKRKNIRLIKIELLGGGGTDKSD